MAFAPTYTLLLFAVFALGLGSGVLDMVLSPIVSALNPTNRAVALNWLHSFYCVGAAVTVLAGSLALAAGFGWRGSCLVLLPLPLGLLIAFAPLRFPDLPHESVRTSVRSLFKQYWFVLASVGIFLGGATELGMAQWLPAYAETSLGFPVWISGGSLLLFSVAMALGRMVVGLAGTRFNAFQLMAWSCGSTVVLFLLGSRRGELQQEVEAPSTTTTRRAPPLASPPRPWPMKSFITEEQEDETKEERETVKRERESFEC